MSFMFAGAELGAVILLKPARFGGALDDVNSIGMNSRRLGGTAKL